MKTEYTREELIELCEKAIVSEKDWSNRDSAVAQKNIGQCWALLKAGCAFEISNDGDLKTDALNIWVLITMCGFGFFEGGRKETEYFYVPTSVQLLDNVGRDWY